MILLPWRLSPCFMSVRLSLIIACASLLTGGSAALAQGVSYAGAEPSVNFGNVNLCPSGASTPAPCSATLTLTYHVTASGTLATPKVLTQGSPNLDFTLASGGTCTGNVTGGGLCTVNVTFTPQYPGQRNGAVQIVGKNEKVLATTLIYGNATGPQIGFAPASDTVLPLPDSSTIYGLPGVAIDGAGDVFLSFENSILKLAARTYAPTTVPFTGLNAPWGVAVDGAGDIFVADEGNGRVVELPSDGSGQVTLPFVGLVDPRGVAVDATGDVYIADGAGNQVLELPAGGAQITLPFGATYYPYGIAVDAAKDVFLSSGKSNVLELPYGAAHPINAPNAYANIATGLALDGIGDVFVASQSPYDYDYGGGVVEAPIGADSLSYFSLGQTYEPQSILNYPSGLAVDSAGEIFVGTGAVAPTSGHLLELSRSQPPVLNFIHAYHVSVGDSEQVTLPLTITNLGIGTLTVKPSFSNPNYKIESTFPSNCLSAIAPQELCTLQVKISESTGGLQDGWLILTTNGATNAAVPLLGYPQVDAPEISPSSGAYATAQSVSILPIYAGEIIYYTTDGSMPTAASKRYTAPFLVTSTGRITAVAFAGNVPSPIVSESYTIASSTPAESLAISGSAWPLNMQFNGDAFFDGDELQFAVNSRTAAAGTGSAFYTKPLNVQAFSTAFHFALIDAVSDGITFTIQNAGVTALGGSHGALGYAGIPKSVALKFDLYNNAGEGTDSTGIYIDGAEPTVPAVDLTGTGINLHSLDVFLAQITYDGTNLVLTLTDTNSLAMWSHTFVVDIPAIVGGTSAYFGFTGATGNGSEYTDSFHYIADWSYFSGTPGPAAPAIVPPTVPTYPERFTSRGLTTNGSVAVGKISSPQPVLQLTDGGTFEAGSAFFSTPVNVRSFKTNFTFQLSALASSPLLGDYSVPLSTIADGMTFTIQNSSASALGDPGEALGYAPIAKSVAIKFDLHDNAGEGTDSTGLFIDGSLPTVPAIDLTGTGIDLHSGHPIGAQIVYNGTNLTLTLTDTVTKASWTSDPLPIDIPAAVGGNTAYVGFTGGTGVRTAVQQVLNWTFTNP